MGFTYEADGRNVPLETMEWDRVWWEHTEDDQSKRVIYIGDSISCGLREHLNQLPAIAQRFADELEHLIAE